MGASACPVKKYIRQYINVRVDFDDEGAMHPRSIRWTDDQEYPIDRVKDIRSAPALKAGGQGDRYTVEIGGLGAISSLNTTRTTAASVPAVGSSRSGVRKPGDLPPVSRRIF